jgi:thioredoxin-like negative regulator of GroEL
MSLIHDAIRRAERETATGALATLGGSRVMAADSEPVLWALPLVFGLVGVVGMATLAWWHWGVNANTMPARPAIALAAKLPAVIPNAVTSPVTGHASPFPAPASQPIVFADKNALASPSPAQKKTTSSNLPLAQAVRTVAPLTPTAQRVAEAVTVAPPKETEVGAHLASFVQQMTAGDLAKAQVELRSIQTKTRSSDTVRVRAEAWFDLSSGNIAAAKAAYRSLLVRHPGDEEASINLASLEAAGNDRDAARTILAEAFRKNPSSDALRNALQRFNAIAGS